MAPLQKVPQFECLSVDAPPLLAHGQLIRKRSLAAGCGSTDSGELEGFRHLADLCVGHVFVLS